MALKFVEDQNKSTKSLFDCADLSLRLKGVNLKGGSNFSHFLF